MHASGRFYPYDVKAIAVENGAHAGDKQAAGVFDKTIAAAHGTPTSISAKKPRTTRRFVVNFKTRMRKSQLAHRMIL